MEERFKTMNKEEIIAVIRKEGKTKKLNLSYSDLSNSDLSNSDLSFSNLRGSNLSNSDLSFSDLSGSDLSFSKITNTTKFSKIKITRKQTNIMLKKMFDIKEKD